MNCSHLNVTKVIAMWALESGSGSWTDVVVLLIFWSISSSQATTAGAQKPNISLPYVFETDDFNATAELCSFVREELSICFSVIFIYRQFVHNVYNLMQRYQVSVCALLFPFLNNIPSPPLPVWCFYSSRCSRKFPESGPSVGVRIRYKHFWSLRNHFLEPITRPKGLVYGLSELVKSNIFMVLFA